MSTTIKGISEPSVKHDGSPFRVAIVHARWNKSVIDALVAGAISKLKESGVKESNIVVQSVPGSFELPLACAKYVLLSSMRDVPLSSNRVIAGSHVQADATATDLLGGLGGLSFGSPLAGPPSRVGTPAPTTTSMPSQAFDAVIAIGVLIKGETMHFEYICESVSHALMKLQLDTGTPVIFGVLTVLNDDQALSRSGLKQGGHNHGEDWGAAAVEMASHSRRWSEGKF